MDVEGIGLILARASELRSKITNCIHKSSSELNSTTADTEIDEKPRLSGSNFIVDAEATDAAEEEAEENLSDIRDAFKSLEAQLSSLQALQQQQFYEREVALTEIDFSRQKLLKKLKEYKGENLEVIKEATAFASETVEDNNDLLLPPYPSRPAHSLISENGFLSHFPSTRSFPKVGVSDGDPSNELRVNLHNSERYKVQSEPKKLFRKFIDMAAKSVLTVVGVVAVLSLAGFEPRLRKRDAQFKILDLFQNVGTKDKRRLVHCPPGKVLVVEDGETRCLVKERVEVPFESVVKTPDVNYGCG